MHMLVIFGTGAFIIIVEHHLQGNDQIQIYDGDDQMKKQKRKSNRYEVWQWGGHLDIEKLSMIAQVKQEYSLEFCVDKEKKKGD